MNLEKLFSAQKKLRERINYNGEDRFEKLILALLVEIGECANEWRGFKFWSKNQEPRTKVFEEEFFKPSYSNPLLEEYVDGLHFVLELGIEKGWSKGVEMPTILKDRTITEQFIQTNKAIINFWSTGDYIHYKFLFGYYIGLGDMLGFTRKEIETAYFSKNQINHSRQENGY